MRGWVAVVAVVGLGFLGFGLLAGCAQEPKTPPFTGEPYLLVWAGDADRQNADFLAVIDADWSSPTYGKVLRTYPVRSRGNEPHRLLGMRDDRRVFGSGLLTNRTFVFDLSQPLAARLLRVDDPGPERAYWAPHEYASLPNGHVVGAYSERAHYRGDPREILGAPGGLLEFTADGQLVREIGAADPAARYLIIAPYAMAVSPSVGRLVSTNAGHGYTASTTGERQAGISVQVWNLDDLSLVRTLVLGAGPRGEENLGPMAAGFLRRTPVVFVGTDEGAALYASDSVHTPSALFRLVFDHGGGALGGGFAITPDDRFLVRALTGAKRVVALDLSDPWKPKAVSSVSVGGRSAESAGARVGGPSALAMSADGSRVAVSDYTMDVPGYVLDGDRRVHLLRLDTATGHLRVDEAFRDELTGEEGVSFERASWPHGDTGPARPAGLVFLSPAPPPDKRRKED